MIKERLNKLPKIFVALLVQLAASAMLAIGVLLSSYLISPPYPFWLLAIVQGLFAAYLSPKFGLPDWWRIIHLLFPIGLYFGLSWALDPLIALGLFVLVILVFSNTFIDRVPLYLSNDTTRQALKKLIENKDQIRFIDLGSGLGGNVAFMSQQTNVKTSVGVETAPLPYLISKLLSLFRGGHIHAQNIWHTDLANYDFVYAFLSPEPMAKLWQKALAEMPENSVFVSNSFAVPEVSPTEVWELADKRETELYIYKISDYKNR